MEGGKVKCQAKGTQHPQWSGAQGSKITTCLGKLLTETRGQLLYDPYKLFIKKTHDIFLTGVAKFKRQNT